MFLGEASIIFCPFFESGPVIVTLSTDELFKLLCSKEQLQGRLISNKLETTEKGVKLFLLTIKVTLSSINKGTYFYTFIQEPVSITIDILGSIIFSHFYLVTIRQEIMVYNLTENCSWRGYWETFMRGMNLKSNLRRSSRNNLQLVIHHHTVKEWPLSGK